VAVLVVVLAYVLARLAFAAIAAAMERRGSRLVLGALAGAAVIVFAGQQLSPRVLTAIEYAEPVTQAYARQVRFVLAMVGPGATAPRLGPSPAFDAGLRGLGGADVLLIFVESYGRGDLRDAVDLRRACREPGGLRVRHSRDWTSGRVGLCGVSDVRRRLLAGAPQPDVGRRSTRPVCLHLVDGVEARHDRHELRAARLPDGGADARHAASLA
jgi:hypothetical protein